MVYLVGAGPGDPGLITLKAVECLRKADVVVYDYLASPELLAHAAAQAELVYVGKKASDHTLPQDQINAYIVARAIEGKTVVRLKGGDPFIFGRGGEEAQELKEAGVAFEIVPGVTSAIAAPAYAGIPLTHRAHASSVAFVTGHENPDKPESALRWDKLATGVDTLVFLMGVRNLASISARLMENGRAPETPAALIRWGSTSRQRVVSATVADIAEKAASGGIKPPAVLVVGDVAALRDELAWFEQKPLFGRTILVTRTRTQASRLVSALAGLGARAIECPTIEITPPESWSAADAALARIRAFERIVFTSPNGVKSFMERLVSQGLDSRALATASLAVMGPGTGAALRAHGLRPDLTPGEYVAESLAEALIKEGVKGQEVLIPRAQEAREVLPERLARAGARVTVAPVYRTVMPAGLPQAACEALKSGQADLVTFTSSSTAANFVELVRGLDAGWLANVRAAVIGPITEKTAVQSGLGVAVRAAEYTIDGLVAAIAEHFTAA